ncbi:MAG: NHL repeat-containing protein [Candidatus Tumulicola sp.]
MKRLRNLVGTCLSAALLAACGGGNSGLAPSTPMTVAAPVYAHQPFVGAPSRPAAASSNLYVLNSYSVTVYAPGSDTVLRTISQGLFYGVDFAFDATGNLYVANSGCTGSTCSPYVPYTLTVYAPGTEKVLRTITAGLNGPVALAFDASGNLYVANSPQYGGPSTVTVYAPGSNNVLRTISQGVDFPDALAFDAAGNIYVANTAYSGDVTVYGPGKTTVRRTITQGIIQPLALALDASGRLYVANCATCVDGRSATDTVTIYARNSKSLQRTITDGIDLPEALAFDGSGNLYAANAACPTTFCIHNHEYKHSTVTVYAPGSQSVMRTIRRGLNYAYRLAFDSSGNIYVANHFGNSGNVTVYAPGSTDVLRTIWQGIVEPRALAFGP